jgi:hypothetical protein
MLSFSERMEQGKAIAIDRRNRGLPTGKDAAGWSRKVRADDDVGSWEWLCREARREWRNDKRQALNDYAAACLSGPHDKMEHWEFH